MQEQPSLILWWEPRWSFAPRELHEFRSSLRLASWLRIIGVSTVLSVLIALITNAAVPGLQFNWGAALAVSVAGIVVFLFLVMILVAAIPPLVFVTQSGFGWWWPVLLHEGFTYFKRSSLRSVTLTVRDDGLHYLRFRTDRLCKRVGLARGVDLVNLLRMFGDLLIVRDRRHHQAGGHASATTPARAHAK